MHAGAGCSLRELGYGLSSRDTVLTWQVTGSGALRDGIEAARNTRDGQPALAPDGRTVIDGQVFGARPFAPRIFCALRAQRAGHDESGVGVSRGHWGPKSAELAATGDLAAGWRREPNLGHGQCQAEQRRRRQIDFVRL
jgi:hypothetical protein